MSAATVWSASASLSVGDIIAPTSASSGLFLELHKQEQQEAASLIGLLFLAKLFTIIMLDTFHSVVLQATYRL